MTAGVARHLVFDLGRGDLRPAGAESQALIDRSIQGSPKKLRRLIAPNRIHGTVYTLLCISSVMYSV